MARQELRAPNTQDLGVLLVIVYEVEFLTPFFFLQGVSKYGKDWHKIATEVRTRTASQIKSHAQKVLHKNWEAATSKVRSTCFFFGRGQCYEQAARGVLGTANCRTVSQEFCFLVCLYVIRLLPVYPNPEFFYRNWCQLGCTRYVQGCRLTAILPLDGEPSRDSTH